MDDEEFGLQPMPALPLDYFKQHRGPWAAMVRFMAWVGVVYAAAAILGELAFVFVYWWETMNPSPGYSISLITTVIASIAPTVAAVVLLFASVMSLRLRPGGRLLMVWASLGVTVCWLVSWAISEFGFVDRQLSVALPRNFFVTMVLNNTVSLFFTTLYRSFVPALLCIFFRRQEVREVFDG